MYSRAIISLNYLSFFYSAVFGSSVYSGRISPALVEKYLPKHSNLDISLVNTFVECSIYVINYPGLDINFDVVDQPIVLLRYFSISHLNVGYLYPIELKNIPNPVKPDDWNLDLFMPRMKGKKLKLVLQHETIFYNETLSTNLQAKQRKRYIKLLHSNYYLHSIKNTKCEARVYYHPPNVHEGMEYYYHHGTLGLLLKDPFWLYDELEFTFEKDRKVWSSRPKVSLLFCHRNVGSSCYGRKHESFWISTALYKNFKVYQVEVILIYYSTLKYQQLVAFCPHCDPCQPFKLKMISTNDLMSIDNFIDYIGSTELATSFSQSLDVSANLCMHEYTVLQQVKYRTIETVLEQVRMSDVEFAEVMPQLLDPLVISYLFPENITINFHQEDLGDTNRWKNIKIDSCPGSKIITYHPKLVPVVYKIRHLQHNEFQQTGLIFQKKQLRFVSCHKKQPHWVLQLRELVIVFDFSTWLLIVFVCLATSHIMTFIYRSNQKQNSGETFTFWLTYYNLFVVALEQGSTLYQRVHLRNKFTFMFTFAFIPLTFVLLGNLYKGDNITRLTLETDLVPFDTFDSLTRNEFKILTRRYLLSAWAFNSIKYWLRVANESFAKNDHEDLIYTSELFYVINSLWSQQDWTGFNKLKDKVTRNLWTYLKNSEMFPAWNSSNKYAGPLENTSKILDLHMKACNKSAVIVPHQIAIRLYNNLKIEKKPVFLGEDVIYENLVGYWYQGYFPATILSRPRYYFQSGIQHWWQTFFKWSVTLKTTAEDTRQRARLGENVLSQENEGQNDIYALCMIPLAGYCLALAVLAIYECKIYSCLPLYLAKLKKYLFKSKVTSLDKQKTVYNYHWIKDLVLKLLISVDGKWAVGKSKIQNPLGK